MSRNTVVSIVAGLLLCLGGVSAYAQQGAPSGLKGRVWVGTSCRCVLSDNDNFSDATFGNTQAKIEGNGPAVGVDFEYLFKRWLGVDLAVGYTNFKVNFYQSETSAVPTARLGLVPVMASVNFHPVTTDKIDLWIGPQVGYIFYEKSVDFSVADVGTYSIKTSNSASLAGLTIGGSYSLADPLSVNAQFRWQNSDADEQLLVDPTLIVLGVGYSF